MDASQLQLWEQYSYITNDYDQLVVEQYIDDLVQRGIIEEGFTDVAKAIGGVLKEIIKQKVNDFKGALGNIAQGNLITGVLQLGEIVPGEILIRHKIGPALDAARLVVNTFETTDLDAATNKVNEMAQHPDADQNKIQRLLRAIADIGLALSPAGPFAALVDGVALGFGQAVGVEKGPVSGFLDKVFGMSNKGKQAGPTYVKKAKAISANRKKNLASAMMRKR